MRFSLRLNSMSCADHLKVSEKRKLARLRRDLVAWYTDNGRNFSWRRKSTSIYEKICVEVLLQRTRAETVEAIYFDFFQAYPNWESIVSASIEQLEERLKPVGLWRRRARSLKGLATYAVENDKRFPSDKVELSKVPAVGQYVANAILMFQHGERRPLLDVNMARVVERIVRRRRLVDIRYDPWLQEASLFFVQSNNPEMVSWSILDFAAITCKSRLPRCDDCCFRYRCKFNLEGRADCRD